MRRSNSEEFLNMTFDGEYILLFANSNEQSVSAQCIDVNKIQNDFEEIESIFDHSCMVKSNREYFWYTT